MIQVKGAIDANTRCCHYHSEVDVIAIKFKCCGTYYGCYYCHEEAEDHEPMVWPIAEWGTKAILCGNCHTELTIHEYLSCNYECPICRTSFNPGCKNHDHLYFEQEKVTAVVSKG
ncbi:CHY zinc finger protein [Paenibacillaceae sp. P-4]|uniref:CHY zinc finger protein n=1 Tax=Paenibacillaceae bacterium P-4 TaxID=3160969 RepID=UPI0032E811A6